MWPFKKKSGKPIYTTVTITLDSDDDFESRAENLLRASGINLRKELVKNAIPNMAEILKNYSKLDADAVKYADNKEPETK